MVAQDTHPHEPPAGFTLLPGERLLLPVITHDKREFIKQPSSLEQILRLTGASHPDEIGKFGPSVAALAFDAASLANSNDSSPEHLRLYEVVFGRDSTRVALDLISSYPELARATVLRLAELQGLEDYANREEQMGRIIHEARDPNSRIAKELSDQLGWEWPYYGSVDATPEFIRTLTAYCKRTEENQAFLSQEYIDRQGNTQTITHALELALAWINRRLSSNPEGLLEFKAEIPQGIENQVWKDSWDAYHHADGTLANHTKGIASIEVQVTTYDALIDAADLLENALDQSEQANELRSQARRLKEAIVTHFWTEDKGGYFVLGTDRDDNGTLQQMKIRTSNMGHVLNSRLLLGDDPEDIRMRESVIRHILSPEMSNVSGIRTLATDELRFRPGSYHNGSVWIWDTHHIAKGIRRVGHEQSGTLDPEMLLAAADDLDRKILNISFTTLMLPEYVRGDDASTPSTNQQTIIVWDEINQRENKVEQPPQEVQAWTAAAILATKKRLQRRGIDLATYPLTISTNLN